MILSPHLRPTRPAQTDRHKAAHRNRRGLARSASPCRASVPVRRSDPERGIWTVGPHTHDQMPDAPRERVFKRSLKSAEPVAILPGPSHAEAGRRSQPGMAARRGAQPPATHGSHEQRPVQRRPDYGNVINFACRQCGTPIVLDPARMENRKLGVFLLCRGCGQRFLVRHTDIGRPAPDAEVASLYADASPEPPPRRRLGRRS